MLHQVVVLPVLMVEVFVLILVMAEELVVVQQIFVTAICLYTAELLLQEEVAGLDIGQHLVVVMEVMEVVVDQEMAVLPQIVRLMPALL